MNTRQKRSILQNQAVIRAIDAMRSGGQVGAGTLTRLRGTSATGGAQKGIDVSGLLQKFGGGAGDPNLAAARQEALANWQGQTVGAEGRYKAPDATPEQQAVLAQRGQRAAAPEAVDARRQDLLGRSGDQAISEDLRKRILARIARRR